MKHDLFISYAHRDDRLPVGGRLRSVVAELKRQLEKHSHPRPERRRQRFRVCTDFEDFELRRTVSDAQRAALEASAALLVICSPASAASRYVRDEIETFKKVKGPEAQILAGDLGLRPNQAFPDIFEGDVLGASLTPPRGNSFQEWRSKLASEAHKIVAKAWNLELAEVHDRFRADQRRQRMRTALLGLSCVGLMLLAWFLVGQIKERRQEEQKRLREEFNAMMRDVQRSYEDGQISHARELLEQARRPEWAMLRSFEWRYFWLRTGASTGTLRSDSEAGWSLSMSPKGDLVAAGMGASVRIWNWRTQQPELTLQGHPTRVHSLAFSPDGQQIVSGGQDGVARIWKVETGQELAQLKGHSEPVWALAWAADGKTIVSVAGAGDYGEVLFWDAQSRTVTSRLDYQEPVRTVDISNRNQVALGIGREGSKSWIEIRDLRTKKLLLVLEDRARIEAVRFFPDGRSLASVGAGDRALRWDLETQAITHFYFGHTSPINDLAVSPDGRLLASGSSDGTVRLWDTETGSTVAILRGHIEDAQATAVSVNAVAFSPDGDILASTGTSLTLRLWQVRQAQGSRVLKHESPVLGIALARDDSVLATATRDGVLRLWGAETERLLFEKQLSNQRLTSVVFSPNGQIIAVGSNDGTVRLVKTETGIVVDTLKTGWSWVEAVALTPAEGGLLSAGGGHHGELGAVSIWQLEDQQLLFSWAAAPDVVNSLDFDPLGLVLIAAGELGLYRFDVSGGSLVREMQGNQPVRFNSEGSLLAYGEHPAIKLEDLSTGEVAVELVGHKGWVNCVAFHPDHQTVATGGSTGRIRLWDVKSGDQRLILDAHEDQVLALVFSSYGQKLYSAGADDVVKVWDVSDSTL